MSTLNKVLLTYLLTYLLMLHGYIVNKRTEEDREREETYYSGIHTPFAFAFWPNRHNFGRF